VQIKISHFFIILVQFSSSILELFEFSYFNQILLNLFNVSNTFLC